MKITFWNNCSSTRTAELDILIKKAILWLEKQGLTNIEWATISGDVPTEKDFEDLPALGKKWKILNDAFYKRNIEKYLENDTDICVFCHSPNGKELINVAEPTRYYSMVCSQCIIDSNDAWYYIRHELIHCCFPPKAQVLTQGFIYKNIKDVKVGDLVFTHNGRLQKVINTMKRMWQGSMRETVLWGNYNPIISTREHPILAIKRNDYKPHQRPKNLIETTPQFFQAQELQKGDFVACPLNNIIKDTTVFEFEKDPEFLWVLGLYLAEGDLDKRTEKRKGGQVRFSLNKKETYFYDRIKQTMEKYGAAVGFTPGIKEHKGSMTVWINGCYWVNIFQELCGEYSDKKRINNRLMYLEPKLQLNIFDGWNDGDGCKGKTTTITTVSEVLAKQMRIILTRNGMFSSIIRKEPRKVKIMGKTTFSNTKPYWLISFNKTSKSSLLKDNILFVLIKSSKDIYKTRAGYDEGYVYNLEVENDNSYQVDGVAVHNCHYLCNQQGLTVVDDQDQRQQLANAYYTADNETKQQIEKENLQDILPYWNKLKSNTNISKVQTMLLGVINLLKQMVDLLSKKKLKIELIKFANEEAVKAGVDTKLIYAVIMAESGFNNDAINVNKDKQGNKLSTDYYVCQINDYWHIGKDKTFSSVEWVYENPKEVIKWMIGQFKIGNQRLWMGYTSGNYKKYL